MSDPLSMYVFELHAWSFFVSLYRSVCRSVGRWWICQKLSKRDFETDQDCTSVQQNQNSILKCTINLYNHKASSAVLGSCKVGLSCTKLSTCFSKRCLRQKLKELSQNIDKVMLYDIVTAQQQPQQQNNNNCSWFENK